MPTKSAKYVWTIFPTFSETESIIGTLSRIRTAEARATILSIMEKDLKLIECRWIIYQTEVSTDGKLHFQGAIAFETARSFRATLKRFPRGTHLEIMKGSCKQSKIYCSKTESRATGADFLHFENGTMPTPGARTDLADLLIYSRTHTPLEIWEQFPTGMARNYRAVGAYQNARIRRQSRRPQTWVFWGDTGTGKSWKCINLASNGGTQLLGDTDFYSILTPGAGTTRLWLDGYLGQKAIVIDDFQGEIDYRTFLKMLDEYPLLLEVKGGVVNWCPTHIYISSNKHPRDWYPLQKYEGGPLERRLNTDTTGHITHLDKPFISAATLFGIPSTSVSQESWP